MYNLRKKYVYNLCNGLTRWRRINMAVMTCFLIQANAYIYYTHRRMKQKYSHVFYIQFWLNIASAKQMKWYFDEREKGNGRIVWLNEMTQFFFWLMNAKRKLKVWGSSRSWILLMFIIFFWRKIKWNLCKSFYCNVPYWVIKRLRTTASWLINLSWLWTICGNFISSILELCLACWNFSSTSQTTNAVHRILQQISQMLGTTKMNTALQMIRCFTKIVDTLWIYLLT